MKQVVLHLDWNEFPAAMRVYADESMDGSSPSLEIGVWDSLIEVLPVLDAAFYEKADSDARRAALNDLSFRLAQLTACLTGFQSILDSTDSSFQDTRQQLMSLIEQSQESVAQVCAL